MKKDKNVIKLTVKYNLCIGCGICKVACESNAITMIRNQYGEITPHINRNKCTNCGLCVLCCPNTQTNLKKEALKIKTIECSNAYGLQNANYYLAWNPDKKQRQNSCSGGAVTKFAEYLFKNNKIQGMIHVKRVWGHRGDLHYKAIMSTKIEDFYKNSSSAYQQIDFSEILTKLEKEKTYFMTGTPCVIRGIKSLIKNNYKFKSIKIITCALICSHNTNSQFIDFLTEINKLKDDEKWKVNLRYKDDSMIDANNFKNYIYTKKNILLNKNRFESGWTHLWRNYYFAMGACLKCPDFWGYEADISVKDAWGEWASDPLGKSIVIIRDTNLKKDFINSNLNIEKLDYNIIKDHQLSTAIFKQTESYNKNFKPLLSKSNRKNGLLKFYIISNCSKLLYKIFGSSFTYKVMKIIEKFEKFGEKL